MDARRSSLLRALVVASVLVAAACTSSAPTVGPGTTGEGPGSPVVPTGTSPTTVTAGNSAAAASSVMPSVAGGATTAAPVSCSVADGYPVGTSTHQVTVDGAVRTFLVHVPGALPIAPALVVDFHGAGSNKEEQSVYSGFDPIADREGFVVATPDALGDPVRQWELIDPSDVDFARALVAGLVADLCVDPLRVYAAGISSGAAMSARLACQAADVFAGFGLVAADLYVPELCAAAPPHPMVAFHGTDDPVVPYAGGPVAVAGGVVIAPAEQTIGEWAEHNGCAAAPTETTLGDDVVRREWTGCREPVTFYEIIGGGHVWPGAAIDIPWLGRTTHTIDATELIWRTFAG